MTNEQKQRLNEIRDWADAFAPKPFVMQQDTMQFLLSLIDEWERELALLNKAYDDAGMLIMCINDFNTQPTPEHRRDVDESNDDWKRDVVAIEQLRQSAQAKEQA